MTPQLATAVLTILRTSLVLRAIPRAGGVLARTWRGEPTSISRRARRGALVLLALLILSLDSGRVSAQERALPDPEDRSGGGGATGATEPVTFTLLQLNDNYEIAPLQNGTVGGLARVATVRQELLRENPRTYTLLSGDFFSPSAIGTAEVDGTPLAGRQMVDVLNTLGLDYATFGNHEFDLEPGPFRQRLAESRFHWVSSNVTDANREPFRAGQPPREIPRRRTFDVENGRGAKVRVGVIGVTLDANKKDYVRYADPIATAREQVDALLCQDHAQVILALTHLTLGQDKELARKVPKIDLILGGHEHNNSTSIVGDADRPPIFKADANAATVYIHRLSYDTETDTLRVDSSLRALTASTPEDPTVAGRVRDWMEKGFQGFRAAGFDPPRVVARTEIPLDGREAIVCNSATDLTKLIGRAMQAQVAAAGHGTPEVALYNSGMIRIDDILQPGPITEYDVIRILPFGGTIWSVAVPGDLLQKTLDTGITQALKTPSAKIIQAVGATPDPQGVWRIGAAPLDPHRTYQVALNDYVLNKSEDLKKLKDGGSRVGELRHAVITYLGGLPDDVLRKEEGPDTR
ncbi:MAG: 5'-nucleotidase C-terminal domain-containing protein [Planctomycetaceae bacterium]|nr:5'-nucleotidase C-terminal domain-containing protein [Planctomycetaceae bacterium]